MPPIYEPGCGNGIDWCVSEEHRGEKNQITAPHIFPYVSFDLWRDTLMTTPEKARTWGREMRAKSALGMKCFGHRSDILEASFD